jgi:hypothetical protein
MCVEVANCRYGSTEWVETIAIDLSGVARRALARVVD